MLSPQRFWKQISYLNAKYGITTFFETGDDFMVGDYLDKILTEKELNYPGLNILLKVYASPSSMTHERARKLRKLGVFNMFLGVESMDDSVLEKCGKDYRSDDINRAVKAIREEGIELCIPFILGLEGETASSLEKSLSFAESTVEKYGLKDLLVTKPVPLYGSNLFKLLTEDENVREDYARTTGRALEKDDDFDYPTLSDMLIERHTEVSREQVDLFIERFTGLAGFTSRYDGGAKHAA